MTRELEGGEEVTATAAPRRGLAFKSGPVLFRTPWYYGWNILAASVLFQASTWGLAATFTLFVAPWVVAFEATRAQLMFAVVLESIAVGLLAPVVGRLLDRVPTGPLVALGGVLVACGLLVISISTELWHLILATTILLAGGKSLSGPLTGSNLAAKWFRQRRGLALGISATGTAVGSMLLVPLGAALTTHLGWRGAHVVLALLCVSVITPLALFVVRSSPESAGIEPEPDSARTAMATPPPTGSYTTLQILQMPILWIIVLTTLPFNIVSSAVGSNLGPFIVDLGLDLSSASGLIATIAAFTIIGKMTLGLIADKIDTRVPLIGAAFSMAAALLIFQTKPEIGLLFLAAALLGFGAGAPLPMIGVMVAKYFERSAFGRVTGITFFFVLAFAGTGAIVGAYIRDVSGSYTNMFRVLVMVLVPIVVAALFLRPTGKKAAPAA